MFRPDTDYRCRGIVRVSRDSRRARFISPLEDEQAKGEREKEGQGQKGRMNEE